MNQAEEKVTLRIPGDVWAWIDSHTWHLDEWEQFRNVEVPKASKVQRALILLYKWLSKVPHYVSRRGAQVTVEFSTESEAQVFCAMLEKERCRQDRRK